ncbi:glycoside hydrolase family 3 C-terminal domain-containing protein [Schleiferilactobacillus perolens]|uniref:Glycosyl hydrolase family 3 N terminal domain protein n=1 Tax=Schleiferilactobacillus perolens DSM 12744 TaxID=1423792 RepID=A0A0R1NB30_9LACO|nr:glycoside hydrolase family 3 C-terminal domain-containing protein [Schleiferilactobacillus perolens]KRL14730.1 glycosyl hydrolase family 3 N terminal domain protein [Schleiferilactobacillus perolens DSM 12744]
MLPYQNKTLTINERTSDLLGRMTLKEKVGQVNQHLYGWKCYKKDQDGVKLTDYFKQHVKWGGGIGALYGVLRADPWSGVNFDNGVTGQEAHDLIQLMRDYVVNHSRLGIPPLFSEECPHGHQGLNGVSYPTNIGKGNSFDTALMTEMAGLQAKELRNLGINLALVSTLDLAKDPRWGRTEECFGEDPMLSAQFSQAIVNGFQGHLIQENVDFGAAPVPSTTEQDGHIGVVLKHFIAQGEVLGGHNSGSVSMGAREFKEVYTPLFNAVKNAAGVMVAYNDIDGVPCHANASLLTSLRHRYQFQGLLMSDGTALDRLAQLYDSPKQAIIAALNAGVDLSLWDNVYTQIADNFDTNMSAALDRAVSHVLRIKFLLGLFDNPFPSFHPTQDETQKLNHQISTESITLLKNDPAVLPLNRQKKVLVVGPNANAFYNLLGDYTAPQTVEFMTKTPLASIRAAFDTADYALGCEIRDRSNSAGLIQEAVTKAANADVIIAFLGGSSTREFNLKFLDNGAVSSKGINMDSGENVDLASLALGGAQNQLIQALEKTGKPIVTVLIEGRPHSLKYVLPASAAVITAWYPGQQGGNAIVDVLTGKVDPSGRLSMTYPKNSGQLPVYYYQRDAPKNEDYYDLSGSPEFPFGYGLHYGKINYSNLTVSLSANTILGSVQVSNRSNHVIHESTLIFVKLFGGTVIQRRDMLKAFVRNTLPANSTQEVVFSLPLGQVKYIDLNGDWTLPDALELRVDNLTKTVQL